MTGKTFVISGSFQALNREVLKNQLQSQGGRLISAVSKNVDYLVAGEKVGPTKLAQARALGVEVISEQAVLALLQLT